MRFGISATSLMCPKNLRTRLRPVNVCCAIGASHFVALQGGEPSRERSPPRPGLNVDHFEGEKPGFRNDLVLNLFFRPAKRKTTCGAQVRTRPSKPLSLRTAKARNSLSPNGSKGETPPLPPKTVLSCCRPIWDDNRGDSRGKPAYPHTFSCLTHIRAAPLHASCSGSPACGRGIAQFRSRASTCGPDATLPTPSQPGLTGHRRSAGSRIPGTSSARPGIAPK